MSSRSNRRKSVCYASIANRSWLAWRPGGEGGESPQVPARLLDISQSGASILIEEGLPLGPEDPAWIRMESPAPSDWVEVRLVGVTPITEKRFWRRGPVVGFLVRVKFVGVCPYDVFKGATHGNQLDATFEQAGPRDEDRFIWR